MLDGNAGDWNVGGGPEPGAAAADDAAAGGGAGAKDAAGCGDGANDGTGGGANGGPVSGRCAITGAGAGACGANDAGRGGAYDGAGANDGRGGGADVLLGALPNGGGSCEGEGVCIFGGRGSGMSGPMTFEAPGGIADVDTRSGGDAGSVVTSGFRSERPSGARVV